MQDIHEYIIKSLQQTSSPEEERQLNEWLLLEDRNVELYCQLQEIWLARKMMTDNDVSREWNHLSRRLNMSARYTVPLWMRYAAAVFLGMLLTFSATWLMHKGTDEKNRLVWNTVINHNGVQKITLPDRSVVWLNPHSRIAYPETFDRKKRTVTLEGKAFFEVQKNAAQPFTVHADDMDVQVTGTSFFVQDDTEKASVTLISGGVTVLVTDKSGHTTSNRLTPGQQVNINRADKKCAVTDVDTSYYVLWKDGTYRFTDEPLEKITAQLAIRYGIKIEVTPALRKKRFTGRITPEHEIGEVMAIISKSHPVRYRIEKDIIYIGEK